ncbi:Glycosyl transferase group 1 [Wenzhouxiangella marina]|uniref:Glycosyl transferase group 1 n=2 Tax=Wenzhouxiangella marina TaxID=1579979 RepID=A0A0K0XYQ5_9GAMM|nr:Glycosyl transferase group 1 [Wenzhouxiangella marina]
MLVGAGELEEHLRHLANDLGVAEQVVFAGFHDDPAPFYASADLFVLTSDREGFGNVIVEAMAQGTPVVCTDCPFGPAEILEGGRFGRLVPVGDEVALAEAMGDVLVNPPDSANLRRRAAEFAPDIAARKYLELLFPT